MNNKIKSISKIIIALMIILSIASFTSMTFAAPITGATDPSSLNGATVNGLNQVTNLGNKAITIVTTIGSVVAVIVLIVLGIKYMMGSTEEKAEYKKTLMPYIIGAALIFAASTIAGMLYSFLINV